jgi:hypothetical protein
MRVRMPEMREPVMAGAEWRAGAVKRRVKMRYPRYVSQIQGVATGNLEVSMLLVAED